MSHYEKFQKIVCARFHEGDLPAEVWDAIQNCAESVVRVADDESPALRSELEDADALIVKLGRPVDAATMESAPRLRYIGVFGTGFNAVDVAEATRRRITVCNIADYSTQGVAEFTVAMALADLRDLHRAYEQAKAGSFDESTYTGRDIRALRVGIVGAGAIGQRTARLIHAGFGSDTCYWSRTRKPALETDGIAYSSLDELLASSDIVSLHIASNPETERFLDAKRLGRLRRHALLISTVPMEVLDFDALVSGLESEKFRLAFDHPDEMDHDDAMALGRLPGVTVYPPIAYTTLESSQRKLDVFVKSLVGFLAGVPVSKVN